MKKISDPEKHFVLSKNFKELFVMYQTTSGAVKAANAANES